MADDTKIFSIDGFYGLNTADKATRLRYIQDNSGGGRTLYPLSVAKNIDIDNAFSIHGRNGYSLVVAGTYPHSVFGNDDVVLFMEGDKMYSIHEEDFSVTQVAFGLAVGARMSYDTWNSRVYFSNGFQIGYIEDLVHHEIPNPGAQFKYPLPAGQFVAVYRGRLYVARDDKLYYSDVMADYYDARKGFMQFDGRINLLRPVEEGIYLSAGTSTYFLNGRSPKEMSQDHAAEIGAIPYTDMVVDGRYFGKENEAIAVWVSTKGIVMGDNKGNLEFLTEKVYPLGTYSKGAGIFLDDSGDERIVEVLNR